MINRRRLKPLAFQANDAGSIPATRSKLEIVQRQFSLLELSNSNCVLK